MNLSNIADLAEIVGNIAVVVSLVYLALQIRQNTQSVRNSTLLSNTDLWCGMLGRLAQPGAVEAYAAGVTGSKDIRPVQYTQFFLFCRGLFVAFENQHYQYRHGALDEETYKGYERAISEQFLAFPGFRLWWQQSRDVFSPDFAEHVDEMIANVALAEPDKYFKEWQSMPRRGDGAQ